MRKSPILLLAVFLVMAILAAPAAAQTAGDGESVLVRVSGDLVVPAGEDNGLVVVVEGDLDFQGTATTVVVVNGNADFTDATLETLIVISGSANLGADTVVTGDVQLVDSDLTQDPTATVEGSVNRGVGSEIASGFWVVGFLFMIGWAILVVLAGLLMAAVAPDLARRAGRTITEDLLPSILAGLVLWIPIPIAAALVFATIVGIPTALAIWLFALPVLGFVGFIVAGIRLGEYAIARDGGTGHPYLASLLGVGALVIAGAIPIIGPIVVTIASFLGSGALALEAFRSARRQPQPAAPAPATPGL